MKKAIITGSTRGLGFAIASRLAQEGYDVAINSRKQEDVEKAEKLISGQNNVDVIARVVDFGDKDSVAEYVDRIKEKWGNIDVLINNVGIYASDRIDGEIDDNLEKMMNVNLMSSVRINKEVVEIMKKNKGGIIIHIISIAAKKLRSDAATYSISKLALKGYNDLLREELKPYGIRVMAFYPGAMNTSSWDGESDDRSWMIQMDDMTNTIMAALNFSESASIEELTINNVKDL